MNVLPKKYSGATKVGLVERTLLMRAGWEYVGDGQHYSYVRRPEGVKAKAPVPPVTTDEEFVRRVYLDVTGHLPTVAEMRNFVLSKDKQKRARLIDGLLQTPAFADNWARYWRDVIAFRSSRPLGARIVAE